MFNYLNRKTNKTLSNLSIRKFTLVISFVTSLLFLISCRKDQPINVSNRTIQFTSSIAGEIQTRANGTVWTTGDQIGVYMQESNSILSTTTVLNSFFNKKFTIGTNGVFTADQALVFPSNVSSVGFTAYYPKKDLQGFDYQVDLTDQTNQEFLDLMLSNKTTQVSTSSNVIPLTFERQLSKLVFNISQPTNSTLDLTKLKVHVNGVLTKAVFDLTKGVLTPNTESVANILAAVSTKNNSTVAEAVLLPDAAVAGKTIVFETVDGKMFTWKVPANTSFEKGKRYSYDIILKADGIITVPVKSGKYFEWPKVEITANTQLVEHMMGTDSKARNYTMLYDTQNKLAYWVAYPLTKSNLGSSGRTDAWGFDPKISQGFQANLIGGYGGGLDRGHQIPSGDRTDDSKNNRMTFYYSNMTPQEGTLNQNSWARLENKVRSWTQEAGVDTMYVVTGAMVTKGSDNKIDFVKDKSNMNVAKPKYYFKALARKKGEAYYTIAYIMDNKVTPKDEDFDKHRITVKDLEKETGFTFFPALTDQVKSVIDNTVWK